MTTLTSKGQVTVPKEIRDYLGLAPGSVVDFVLGLHGEVLVRPAEEIPRRRKGQFNKIRGTLKMGKSTDELMALLRDYEGDKHDPGLK